MVYLLSSISWQQKEPSNAEPFLSWSVNDYWLNYHAIILSRCYMSFVDPLGIFLSPAPLNHLIDTVQVVASMQHIHRPSQVVDGKLFLLHPLK